jgi:hypothetical protein
MPVRITFDAPDIRAHVTTLELQGVVTDYIKDTYNVDVTRITEEERILLDPGGMAFSNEVAKFLDFSLAGIDFRCQPLHVQGVNAYLEGGIKMVNSPVGLLLKIYLPYCIVVLPGSLLWALKARINVYEVDSKIARIELQEILNEANARANASSKPKEEDELIN